MGLGASAGGLEAFKAFLEHLPPDSGMALVLIQHLDPLHKSLLVELLGRHTALPVVQAEDGMALAPDRAHVIPPNAVLTIRNGILGVITPAPPRHERRPIDMFFASLAEDQEEKAVAIILAGSGSDGSLGLKAIKEHGGLALAQAKFDETALLGMPSSAAATGLVDEVLPVERMPARLLAYAEHLSKVGGRKAPDGTRRDAAEHLTKIFRLLQARLGHDFSEYKQQTLVRRIQRRMQVLQIDSVADYVERLRMEPAQLDLLFHDLLIGVTRFFRDPEAFGALEREVIPTILEKKRKDDQIRIWVPGCATGEEAYSIAILMKESMVKLEVAPKVQIFATDLDEHAIAVARHGRYPKARMDVSSDRLTRWFAEEGDNYCVVKDIREMCVFSTHNLAADPPFSKLDLISCRNLLIYFDASLQNRLMQRFHHSLRESGHLFLGLSEGLARQSGLFSVLDRKFRIFRRRDDVARVFPHGPAASPREKPAAPSPEPIVADVEQRARQTLEKYSPVFLVVNRQHDVLRFSGRTGNYIEHASGEASLKLFQILRKDLASTVRGAVQEVIATQQPVLREDVLVGADGGGKLVNLIVAPISDAAEDLYVIAFQEQGLFGRERAPAEKSESANARVKALEKELRATRLQLQDTIDDLAAANEEMKSSSEEYQSVNEEFQSANEELESSKEELQSVNEELQTINAELAAKNEALGVAVSDVRNLLDSTRIATLFLDPDLAIRSFTPTMAEIFHLRAGDRGRPITEIATRLTYDGLKRDAGRVLRSLSAIEREVAVAEGGATFLMRIQPYRTVSDVIAGVVITFVDISDRKRHEEERGKLAAIVDSSQDAIIEHTLEGTITSWNPGAETIFGYAAREALGKPLSMLIPAHQTDEIPRILAKLAAGESIGHFEIGRVTKAGKRIDISMTISPVKDESGRMIAASTVARDVTERRQHEEERARLAAIVDSSDDAIISTDLAGTIVTWNRSATRLFGYAAEEVIGGPMTMLYLPDRLDEMSDILARIRRGQRIDRYDAVGRRKDGSLVNISLTISPISNDARRIIGASKIVRDDTERTHADQLRSLMVDELNHRVKNTLATVQSIAAQSLKIGSDAQSRETFDARLVALSRTHDLLARRSWERVSLGDLLLQELEPYRSEEGARFVVAGPEFAVSSKAALVLGLAFHELATNAAKYGALSGPEGQVRVSWKVVSASEPKALRLEWAESGGPPVQRTGHKGFGSILIERGLSLELDGKVALDFDPGGLICTIEIPLPEE